MVLSDFFEGFGEATLAIAILSIIFAAGFATTIGIVCMNIMKKKGYDSLAGWFCCGFFLGIFGLIICLCIEDRTKQIPPSPFDHYVNPPYPNQPMPDHQTARQCPHCGMTNPIEARFCNACGEKLK
ncbi:MAG: zinc-ribbon domain-containing protein [Ruminococcus sp.]|nr:zinc-ribbon domain-containing protein [Ruminococcus sp.]